MAPASTRLPLASSASSGSGSDRSSSMPRSSRSGGSSSKRSCAVADRTLLDVAAETESAIHWGEILKNATDEAGNKQWKWLDRMDQFSLYSKVEPGRYAVMASGVLACSVPEVVHLLHAPNGEKFLQNMEALYGDEFRDGAFVHRVNVRALEEDGAPRNTDLLDLSVKSALLGNNQKWSFVDAAYRRQDGAAFEKLTSTLDPDDVEGSTLSESSNSHKNILRNVTAAFMVQPELPSRDRAASETTPRARPWKETRVFFYAEMVAPPNTTLQKTLTGSSSNSSSSNATFDRSMKERLLNMARSCERLTELVRRRRLGLFDLPERKSASLFSGGPTRCACCNKSLMLLGIKHCKLCVQTVCTECSRKHERETHVRGSQRLLLEDIRVCDRCMDRVDRSELPELDNHSLLTAPVTLHPAKAPSPQTTLLTELLNSQLLQADSNSRKASVMNVIKCMLDQDEQPSAAAAAPAHSSTRKPTRAASSSRGGGIMLMDEDLNKLSIH